MMNHLIQTLARKSPQLELRLSQARIDKTPEQFTKQILYSSFYISFGACFSLWMLLDATGKNQWYSVIALPIFTYLTYLNFSKTPELKIKKLSKEIEREIVFAGKFMIIEMKSGIPMYNAFKNIGENYPSLGVYFNEILRDIDFGTDTETAINTAILKNPSRNFQKVLWQLTNSLKTGADISRSMETVLDQINKEQLIEVEKYGKKLNPIAVFYLMLAVIFPSLGMVMVTIFVSFIDINISLSMLILLAIVSGLSQTIFLGVIKSNQPAIEL
jgi:flagellar protein FlaJ